MADNIEEWVNDWSQADYYSNSPPSNPPGPVSGTYKVPRGGYWANYWYSVRVATRSYNYPEHHSYYYGFRCAASGP